MDNSEFLKKNSEINQNYCTFDNNHQLTKMVAKGKLKMALDAQKGVDYKKKHQDKLVKVARKSKKSKKQEDDWEDVQSENEDDPEKVNLEEGDAEDDEGSEDESDDDEQIKVSHRSRAWKIQAKIQCADRLCCYR